MIDKKNAETPLDIKVLFNLHATHDTIYLLILSLPTRVNF